MDVPFRGSAAVAAGLVTWARLRGPRYVRLFPDIYAPVADGPPDLALRSRGAALLVAGRGVLSGYSAAELLRAPCAPANAPAEVTVRGRQRAHPGLRVHRGRLAPGEIGAVDDIPVTTADRVRPRPPARPGRSDRRGRRAHQPATASIRTCC